MYGLVRGISLSRSARSRVSWVRPYAGGRQCFAKHCCRFLERLGCGSRTQEGRQLLEAIRTDGWRSYGRATKNRGVSHYKVVLRNPGAAGKLLPWVHRVISNAKAVIRGSHRGVSEKHLQAYLSEVCYRFNRRFWEKELFDRLV